MVEVTIGAATTEIEVIDQETHITVQDAPAVELTIDNPNNLALEQATAAALTGSAGSSLVGHASSETGAVARDVQSKLDEWVSPEDFTGSDTAKINAALATGKSVRCSASSYSITSGLSLTADGQIFDINGALITATGDFDIFSVSGHQGTIICNGRIEAASMTGGDVLNLSDVERTTFENMLVFNPFNFAFVEESNVAALLNVWVNNIRGAYGIRWLGDDSKRSDVLRLIGVTMSFPDTGIGIDWDGNCHTLQGFGVIIVRPNKGIKITKTSGATAPAFGFFPNIEIDFPQDDAIDIQAGEDFYFGPQLYVHGSVAGSGIVVGSSINADRVSVFGGKITSHARYGVENDARLLVSNIIFDNNTLGDFSNADNAVATAPRLEIDSQYYMRLSGGDPVFQFDDGDFMGFNRSANDLFFNIGGSNRFQVSADSNAIRMMVDGALKQVFVGDADSAGTGFRTLRVSN